MIFYNFQELREISNKTKNVAINRDIILENEKVIILNKHYKRLKLLLSNLIIKKKI